MSYCKKCVAGHINIYESSGDSPAVCETCGRLLMMQPEEIYQPEKEPENSSRPDPGSDGCENAGKEVEPTEASGLTQNGNNRPEEKRAAGFSMYFETPDGRKFPFGEKVIFGRNSTGKQFLKDFSDVSREHFSVKPRFSGICATVTDLSRFGTFVNGERLEQHAPRTVSNGAVIQLGHTAQMKFVIENRSEEENGTVAEVETGS